MQTTSILAALLLMSLSPRLDAAPRLVLSATTLTPAPISPGSNGPAQSVEAKNGGDGTLNLTASSTASWLSATVGALKPCVVLTGTCNPVTITLATASLGAGTYTEFITLTDPNAVDSPQQIAVTITIAGVPSSLTFYVGPAGTSNENAFAYIYPASPVTAVVSTQTGGNWLGFDPAGSFIVASPSAINVGASRLSPGTYTGSVTISGSTLATDNKTIAVTLVVTASPVIDLSQISTMELFGAPGSGKTTSYLTFATTTGITSATTGGSALNITGATGSTAFLSASVFSPTTIAISADPTGLSPGTYHGNVTISSNAANNAAVSVPVDFVVSAAAIGTISANGIVNPITYLAEPFAPGEIASVFGTFFAGAGTAATNPGLPPLATNLGGTQLLVNGSPAPLYYVSPTQINFQIPYSLTAGQTATAQVVSGGVPGNLRPITIVANSPRLLVLSSGYALAFNASDGSLPLPSSVSSPSFVTHPAKPGDVLTFYGVGFGQTSPPAVEGVAATASPLQNAATTTVSFGGGPLAPPAVTATPLFSGLSPTQAGLYQINVTLPPNVLGSAIPVNVTVGSGASNTVNVAISANGQ
jgi:uncharacterized protein (TIGR03437 family)